MSLRRQLTIRLVCVTAALGVAAAASLYMYVRQKLLKEFDDALTAKAHAVASLLRIEPDGKREFEYIEASMPEYLPGRHAEYFEVFDHDGRPFARSASLRGKNLCDASSVSAAEPFHDMLSPSGHRLRARVFEAAPHPEEVDDYSAPSQAATAARPDLSPYLVIVARDRSEIDRVLSTLLSSLGVATIVLSVATILSVRFIVSRGLRPVRQLAEQAAGIGPETLDDRFDESSLPDELRPICARFNDLLERLERGFRRERRLNADIAHELRTPISELRSLTDVARKWPCDPAQSAEYFRDAHDIAVRMESVVETLLALARSQAQKPRVTVERVRLSAELQDVISESVGSSRVDLQACKLEYSIVSPK